jgi:cytochrome c-type biogenesis protein CcmH
MKTLRGLACIMALVLGAGSAPCETAATPHDEQLEAHVTALAQQLRCLVCQNQTIADSQAPLAVDLRQRIREQLATGSSDRAVFDYMTARYGAFVLYRPPVTAVTALLWFGPFALLVAGLVGLFHLLRRRHRSATPEDVSEHDRQRLHELLHPEAGRASP